MVVALLLTVIGIFMAIDMINKHVQRTSGHSRA
jgi:hypothetical protein